MVARTASWPVGERETMRLFSRLSAQRACRYAVLSRCAPSAAARRHATCGRVSLQLPTTDLLHADATSAMAPVTPMLNLE